MDAIRATETLNQIFIQAYVDEDYWRNLEKIGVVLEEWPSPFVDAKKWNGVASTKTHRVAGVEVPITVPEAYYDSERLDLEDTKAVYREALDFLIGLDLARAIQMEPGRYRELYARADSGKSAKSGMYRPADMLKVFLTTREYKAKNKITQRKIKGWEKFSEIIDGWEPGRVSIISGATGVGKTNAGISLFIGATESEPVIKTLYIQMEMSIDDMATRIVQSKSGYTKSAMADWGFMDAVRNSDVASWAVASHDHWITDGLSLSMPDIERKIMALKREQNLDLVIIDYDQKIYTDSPDDEWMLLLKAAMRLEEVAKRENIHICLFSQADEKGMPKASKRSMQPASFVAFIYFDDQDKQFKMRWVKNRHGPAHLKMIMKYHPEISRLTEKEIENADRPEKTERTETKLHLPNQAVPRPRGPG